MTSRSWINGVSKTFWDYTEAYARSRIFRILKEGIIVGELKVTDSEGSFVFGAGGNKGHTASLVVSNNEVWVRILLTHDLGFAEGYMLGYFTTPNLKSLFQVWLDNRNTLAPLSTYFNQVRYAISAIASRLYGQSLAKAIPNVVMGYDCSNTLFKAFLSEEMMYSCALWSEDEGGLRGDLDNGCFPGQLEAAQKRKIEHILRKARVKKGDRILEFGSGWGAMAIAAAQLGCTVDTLTLSIEQKKLAEARIASAGLGDRIHVHFMDYRCMPQNFEQAFDAFVACEMFEAVGLRHHAEFFKILDWALKPNRATAVVTATAQPEFRYSEYQGVDYARKYQWPNTFLPSATSFVDATYRAIGGRLVVESIEDHGPHYARTLREWGRRLDNSWTKELKEALSEEQPDLRVGDNLGILKRKWEYMYAYAEVGYSRAYTSMNCWTLARPEYVSQVCD